MRITHRLSDLMGYSLNASDGEIGKLEQVYFDDECWEIRYFVVHTGGWLLGRNVLIAPSAIKAINNENKCIEVDLTQAQIKDCPPIDTEMPISRHYEQEYYRYYGWQPYWTGDLMFGPAAQIPQLAEGAPKVPEHPHLRSSNEVESYSIQALDGDIGHVEGFILEEPGWAIRYLEVDTRNWLPGKHVLVAPTWIEQVDWAKQAVAVKLKREAIETAPAYDPGKIISRDYQLTLFKHYGMKYHRETDLEEL